MDKKYLEKQKQEEKEKKIDLREAIHHHHNRLRWTEQTLSTQIFLKVMFYTLLYAVSQYYLLQKGAHNYKVFLCSFLSSTYLDLMQDGYTSHAKNMQFWQHQMLNNTNHEIDRQANLLTGIIHGHSRYDPHIFRPDSSFQEDKSSFGVHKPAVKLRDKEKEIIDKLFALQSFLDLSQSIIQLAPSEKGRKQLKFEQMYFNFFQEKYEDSLVISFPRQNLPDDLADLNVFSRNSITSFSPQTTEPILNFNEKDIATDKI